ncbi:MAG: hypothetical protein ACRCYY_16145 [Trueperaceae bacterium]
MKRHLIRLAALGALSVASLGFAQTDTHDVTVRIPSVLQLRVTNGTSNAEATNPSVTFDYQAAANINTYLNSINAGGGLLNPTATADFGNILVFSNRTAGWTVTVSSAPLTYTNNLSVAGATGLGVALGDIRVAPSGTRGSGVGTVTANYDMSGGTVATGTRTTGWSALGISGADYRLNVNGDEDPGQYTTVVTYTIATP